jgi:hypothetical protein
MKAYARLSRNARIGYVLNSADEEGAGAGNHWLPGIQTLPLRW